MKFANERRSTTKLQIIEIVSDKNLYRHHYKVQLIQINEVK